MNNHDKYLKLVSRTRKNFPKTMYGKGLKGFIEKNREEIDKRVNSIMEEVKRVNKGENLGNEFSYKNIRDGVIGELLFFKLYGGKLSESFFEEHDIELPEFRLYFDIKTLSTKQKLNGSLNHLKIYLQEKQVKEHIRYVPVLLNYETDEILIIVNLFGLHGETIKSVHTPKFENPPFTSIEKQIYNYVIPYSLFYNKN